LSIDELSSRRRFGFPLAHPVHLVHLSHTTPHEYRERRILNYSKSKKKKKRKNKAKKKRRGSGKKTANDS